MSAAACKQDITTKLQDLYDTLGIQILEIQVNWNVVVGQGGKTTTTASVVLKANI